MKDKAINAVQAGDLICRFWDKHHLPTFLQGKIVAQILNLPEACTESQCESAQDLISRQAAIEALGEEPLVWCDGEDEIAEREQWRRDVDAVKALPSAQPERKTGKRINKTVQNMLKGDVKDVRICSECNAMYFRSYGIDDGCILCIPNYCPNCGTKMEVEQDDE